MTPTTRFAKSLREWLNSAPENQSADRQHQESDVRVEQKIENPLPQRHLHLVHRESPTRMQLFLFTVEAFDRPAVDLTRIISPDGDRRHR